MDNWLVAVVAGAFLLGLIIGIARGAIKITVSLLATIVTFVLVFFLTPYVSKGIQLPGWSWETAKKAERTKKTRFGVR